MPPNLHVKLSKLLSVWQPPPLLNRMSSMVTYGKILARIVANSLSQGQYQYVPITSSYTNKAIQTFSYSSPGEFHVSFLYISKRQRLK